MRVSGGAHQAGYSESVRKDAKTPLQYIVGVDEVGRGPVAGPVTVCAAVVERDFDITQHFPKLTDSKLLTPKRREAIFEEACVLEKEGALRYAVSYESAKVVDGKGIERAVRSALEKSIMRLHLSVEDTHIFLDGRLKAPDAYRQETIVRGDSLIPIISLASVIAKVSRDRFMERSAKQYPEYGFERHKGYGTRAHLEAIRAHGLSPLHRESFLTKALSDLRHLGTMRV